MRSMEECFRNRARYAPLSQRPCYRAFWSRSRCGPSRRRTREEMKVASVELKNVNKNFGKTEVIRDVSLNIADRELVVFVGPSGCGKSTLLRLIAGLEDLSSGTLRIGDRIVNDVPAADRGIAMVFQSYALYPHMTVAENMGFALHMLGTPRAEVERKVHEAAEILHLSD